MIDHHYTIRVTDGELLMTVRTEESVESCKNAVGVRMERWIDRARLLGLGSAKIIEYARWNYEITDETGRVVEQGKLGELPLFEGAT
jgi:hypothetical protein